MVVLYCCIGDFEEAVKCYNYFIMIRTNMNLSTTETGLERDASEENSAASFITMKSAGDFTFGQKDKLTNSINIIFGILQEQGEFQRVV